MREAKVVVLISLQINIMNKESKKKCQVRPTKLTRIDAEIHREIRIAAAEAGVTMGEQIAYAVRGLRNVAYGKQESTHKSSEKSHSVMPNTDRVNVAQ